MQTASNLHSAKAGVSFDRWLELTRQWENGLRARENGRWRQAQASPRPARASELDGPVT